LQHVGVSRSYRVDGQKARRLLGYEPCRRIADAVSEMWDELENGVDTERPLYYNIRWFELLVDMEKRLQAMGGSVF
jgi:hypothetical protein